MDRYYMPAVSPLLCGDLLYPLARRIETLRLRLLREAVERYPGQAVAVVADKRTELLTPIFEALPMGPVDRVEEVEAAAGRLARERNARVDLYFPPQAHAASSG